MIFENYDRIVFIGDSVTDACSNAPVTEWGDGLGFGYVRMIDNLISMAYPELNIRVTNSGVNGHTTRDLLARWQTDLLDLNPNWVSICIGINDVWRQFDRPACPETWVLPEEYEANLTKMIESIKDKVKGIFIMSPYLMEPLKEDRMRSRMDEYGAICRKLAEKYGCEFIDLQAMFNEYFVNKPTTFIAGDRVHPNMIGSTLIAREFLSRTGFDYLHKA